MHILFLSITHYFYYSFLFFSLMQRASASAFAPVHGTSYTFALGTVDGDIHGPFQRSVCRRQSDLWQPATELHLHDLFGGWAVALCRYHQWRHCDSQRCKADDANDSSNLQRRSWGPKSDLLGPPHCWRRQRLPHALHEWPSMEGHYTFHHSAWAHHIGFTYRRWIWPHVGTSTSVIHR